MADPNYIVPPIWAARLEAMWRWQRTFKVAGAASFRNGETQCEIVLPPPPRQATPVRPGRTGFWAVITDRRYDEDDDVWKYLAAEIDKAVPGPIWGVMSGGRVATGDPEVEEDPTANGTYLYNIADFVSPLRVGARVWVFDTREYAVPVEGGSEGETEAVGEWWTWATPPQGVFPVGVTVDGGDQGTASAAASYTYEVTDESGVIGTGMTPLCGRSVGRVGWGNGGAGVASRGIAFYLPDGTLVLWDAGERPKAGGGCA